MGRGHAEQKQTSLLAGRRRRGGRRAAGPLLSKDLRLDTASRTVRYGAAPALDLSIAEGTLLAILLSNPLKVFSYPELLRVIYPDASVSEAKLATLATLAGLLRTKLARVGAPDGLVAEVAASFGYRLEPL